MATVEWKQLWDRTHVVCFATIWQPDYILKFLGSGEVLFSGSIFQQPLEENKHVASLFPAHPILIKIPFEMPWYYNSFN